MFNLPLTKSSQDRQTLENRDEKQYCQVWMLRLVVTNCTARKERLLKICMVVKSARTVSRELYWEKRVYIGLITLCG